MNNKTIVFSIFSIFFLAVGVNSVYPLKVFTGENSLPELGVSDAPRVCTWSKVANLDDEAILAPLLFPKLKWTEVVSPDDYLAKHSLEANSEPVSLKGKVWSAEYVNVSTADSEKLDEVENYYKTFAIQHGWEYKKYIHGYALSGIVAGSPGDGAVSYILVHNGVLRVVALQAATSRVYDPRTTGGDEPPISIGITGISYEIFISEPIKLVDLFSGYKPASFLGLVLGDAVMVNKKRGGFVVAQVVPGSPADKAGIKEADVILSIDNKSIVSNESLPSVINGYCPADSLIFSIERDGQILNPLVILGEY